MSAYNKILIEFKHLEKVLSVIAAGTRHLYLSKRLVGMYKQLHVDTGAFFPLSQACPSFRVCS